jgi:hypothetical protein
MPLIRKKLSESDAAYNFMQATIADVDSRWTDVYGKLQEYCGPDFRVKDEELAKFDLTLALIALNKRAIKNLFPSEQAQRLEAWTLESLNLLRYPDYAETEIALYGQAWEKAFSGEDPRDVIVAIPSRLVRKWLGERIRIFAMPTDAGDIVRPSLLLFMTSALMQFIGYWPFIKKHYRLVP